LTLTEHGSALPAAERGGPVDGRCRARQAAGHVRGAGRGSRSRNPRDCRSSRLPFVL